MVLKCPSLDEVRKRLMLLSQSQLVALSARSGVPLNTIDYVRRGYTVNPGLLTVSKLLDHVDAAERDVEGAQQRVPMAPRKKVSTTKKKVKTTKAKRKET